MWVRGGLQTVFSWIWPILQHGYKGELAQEHVSAMLGSEDHAKRLWEQAESVCAPYSHNPPPHAPTYVTPSPPSRCRAFHCHIGTLHTVLHRRVSRKIDAVDARTEMHTVENGRDEIAVMRSLWRRSLVAQSGGLLDMGKRPIRGSSIRF
jgi:hypothetical protein